MIDIDDSKGKKPPMRLTKTELLDKLARVAGRVVAADKSITFVTVGRYASEVAHEFELTTEDQEYFLKKLVAETGFKGDRDASEEDNS